ncbi:hypothetical protein N44_03772 [Microcystis aeruginosa NIES-44]|uniref:Uncharacterized protein n=1 Tax=Microcystis aeruginosa NIES-44 TaxID=449439 RepID=A0A0A1VYR7_MICAE|nr:hypothetical protein N44_03772 [Microcystis aeruginosa NIES-44]
MLVGIRQEALLQEATPPQPPRRRGGKGGEISAYHPLV